MRLRFKATEAMGSYNGYWGSGANLVYVRFQDGQVQDLPDGKAVQLLRDFPLNFEAVVEAETREIESPPVDRMFKRKRAKVK
jgi:hypothetical protein